GTPQNFPVLAKRRAVPVNQVKMLLIRDARDRVLLVKRPPAGLWGGLWGLPECTQQNVRAWCHDHLGLDIRPQKSWPAFRHSFSHFHLDITPIPARATGYCERVMENGDSVWYNVARPDARGLAAPVQKLLQQLGARRSFRKDT
ncbi:MAG: NUDIX domain-containing protein, partial [Sulfuricaulis sp.]|nr:NUDIX domain-containing protein [Sulfuricaulis sp.]